MGQITSSVGLVSGINTGDIINQLMAIEARPVNLLQSRIDGINQQKLAYTGLSTQLASLNINGQSLDKQSTFQNATATSSDESVVTATAATGAAPGSYQVQVAQLVTTQQIISSGYADFNSTKIGAGTITIGVGGGELTTLNSLASLNGGAGASRGQFRITDRSGNSAIIDTSAAVTLQDVVKKINTSLDIQVHASIKNDSLVLTDTSGQTTSNLVVQDVADGHAAADLGIVGSVASDTLTGTDINYIGTNTQLSQLNDGRGVGNADGGTDFTIQPGDGGAAVNVSIATLTTVGQVINAINTATAGRVTASVSPGDNHLTLTDKSGGTVTVTAAPGSTAASDLGIAGSGTGTVTGSDLISGLGTVLVSSLNGGSGLPLGTISIKDRADTASVDVDLSGARPFRIFSTPSITRRGCTYRHRSQMPATASRSRTPAAERACFRSTMPTEAQPRRAWESPGRSISTLPSSTVPTFTANTSAPTRCSVITTAAKALPPATSRSPTARASAQPSASTPTKSALAT